MLIKRILPIMLVFLAPLYMYAQQTTSIITGTVKDSKDQSLAGATVTALNIPSGTSYSTTSGKNGAFTLPNMRVGGSYRVTVTYVGFAQRIFEDINLVLGNPTNINVVLENSSATLNTVTVTAAGRGIINSQRNGTSTNISSRLIQSLPSINRNIQDFARLTPQAKAGSNGNEGSGTGLSFAGQSNRYNQFSVDGANASDAFGLTSSGTNGGAANLNPVSIEAIQEIQIVLAPYDVTQGGFTGGGINAVTKSGTNTFHGSAYGQYQNQSFVGKSSPYNSSIARLPYGNFKNETFGASLGGPIIKNKLFFFTSAERFKKTTPVSFDPTVAGSGSKVNPDTLKMIRDFMLKNYGFDLGSYGAINNENQSTSLFGRIDWNISDKHKLTFRHNYVHGTNDIGRSRSATAAYFENTGYKNANTTNSSVIELNSNFSSAASNVLRLTYNAVRDARVTPNAPNLFITNYDVTQKASLTYTLGSEYSSAANSLNQDIFSVTDNFTLYKGSHTFTFGTSDEFFKSSNVFLQGYYGAYTYNAGNSSTNNITNWMSNTGTGLTQYQVGYSTAGRGDKAPAVLKSAQLSAYGQDIWAATKNFKLTYGLRVDLPYISNNPPENTAFNTAFASYGVSTNQMPKQRLMYSPRVGFNWNVQKIGTQVRGGLGMFTGRIPFVWISNQFSNTGVATKNLSYTTSSTPTVGSTGVKYTFNPDDPQLGAYIPAAGTASPTVINVIDRDFKFPQIFRTNLGFDKKLGNSGFIATIEGVFTKNINNAFYSNLNISDNGESTVAIGPTTRPYWSKPNFNTAYTQVIKLSNTSEGYSYNLTAQIQKTYSKGWAGSLAYNYGRATSLNDIPSSVALSNWTGVQSVNGLNKLELSPSNFDVGSRVTGFVSKEFKYLKHFATTITLFYSGQSGQRLSYVYATAGGKNITGESTSGTSLAYIPANATEANFADIAGVKTASQQWTDFQAFQQSNPYLLNHAGQNAQRNGDRMPFENHFDLRIAQDFLLKNNKLQVFADVVNIGALLNSSWGRAYGTGTTPDGFFPTTTSLFSPVVSGAQKKDGVAFTPTANNPAFQFNINNFTQIGDDYKAYNVNNFTSRWNAQIGLRYSF